MYQFFSVISKSLIGPANRCSGCPPAPEAVLSLCVPPGVGREEEKVHPAAAGAAFKMPTWPELSVSKLWPIVRRDPAFADYFPTQLPKGKLPEKQFFWGVIFTIKRPDLGFATIGSAAG